MFLLSVMFSAKNFKLIHETAVQKGKAWLCARKETPLSRSLGFW